MNEKDFRWINYELIIELLEKGEKGEKEKIIKIIQLQQRKEKALEELERNHNDMFGFLNCKHGLHLTYVESLLEKRKKFPNKEV